jgi:hypothetical protein
VSERAAKTTAWGWPPTKKALARHHASCRRRTSRRRANFRAMKKQDPQAGGHRRGEQPTLSRAAANSLPGQADRRRYTSRSANLPSAPMYRRRSAAASGNGSQVAGDDRLCYSTTHEGSTLQMATRAVGVYADAAMGAWGEQVFQNDSALDWLAEFEVRGLAMLRETLSRSRGSTSATTSTWTMGWPQSQQQRSWLRPSHSDEIVSPKRSAPGSTPTRSP